VALRIGFASKKGGPGKSTTARATAVGYAQNNWSVKIADFDLGQSTSTRWHRRRLARKDQEKLAAVAVEQFGSVAQAMAQAEHYDLLIFDGAPTATMATVDMARACDLLVIPTGLAVDDMEPAVELADKLHFKDGIPVERIAFALNHASDSDAELAEAREYLSHKPYFVLEGQLVEKITYRRAMDVGLSAIEVTHKGLRAQAERLIQSIITRASELS
jgi:chromosome partitioning protein